MLQSRWWSILVVASVVMLWSCSKRSSLGDRSRQTGSGLTDVDVTFNADQLRKDLGARLKELRVYNFSVASQGTCPGQNPIQKNNVTIDWGTAAEYVIKLDEPVKQECEYLLKLEIGDVVNGQFVAFSSNAIGKAGTPFATEKKDKLSVKVRMDWTEEGKKKGFDKLVGHIDTVGETELDVVVDFGQGLRLFGEYESGCVSDGQTQPTWRSRSIKISNNDQGQAFIEAIDRRFNAANCPPESIQWEEQGKAAFNVGQVNGPLVPINLQITEKTRTLRSDAAVAAHNDTANPDNCGVTWTKEPANLLLASNENCKKHLAGISMWDVVVRNNELMFFGLKDATNNGFTAATRPVAENRSDFEKMQEKQ